MCIYIYTYARAKHDISLGLLGNRALPTNVMVDRHLAEMHQLRSPSAQEVLCILLRRCSVEVDGAVNAGVHAGCQYT